MQYRSLGRTGVQVSRLCFGTMSFGGDADEATSGAMFRRCRDAGINFFDTANVYNGGRSEEILGRLVGAARDELVLATKVHFPTGKDPNARGLSRRHIVLAVEQSLRRLGTDRIDLYYAHGFDERTPIDETLAAFDDLVRHGKVLYLGASNWSAWQVAKGLGISARAGLARFQCIQPMYSLVKRQAEVELLPMALSEGLAVVSYSPLGGGMLSGKYGRDRAPSGGRLVDNAMYKTRYGDPGYRDVADRLVTYSEQRGVPPATLAVGWVLGHPAVSAAIIGARNVEQLEASLAAAELETSGTERDTLSALSPEPPPATDRSEERRGQLYGALPK